MFQLVVGAGAGDVSGSDRVFNLRRTVISSFLLVRHHTASAGPITVAHGSLLKVLCPNQLQYSVQSLYRLQSF